MKVTLLKLVQDILSAMDSDEVNSIGDTVEARQVATVVQTTYNNIVARTELPEHYEVFELKASGDPSKPILMSVPISVDTVEWVQYNSSIGTGYEGLKFLPPQEYIERNYSLGKTIGTDPSVSKLNLMVGDSSVEFFYYNDRDPKFYTHLPGVGVLLDGVNLSVVDTNLKTSSLAYGRRNYEFDLTDDFVPPLDSLHFNILYQESKALAFAELKQTAHAWAEKSAKDSRIHAQRRKDQDKAATFYRNLPNYGRR